MKTLFPQLSINRFPLFLSSVAVVLTGTVFIWFIRHLFGYEEAPTFAGHQRSAWLVMAIISIFVVTAAWLWAIRVFYKSQKILLTKNAEMKRAEEALRQSEARYRVVTESASDAILTIDREQTILFVNPAAEKIFGYTVAEMLGNKLFMLMPERARAAHAAGMKRYGETKKRNISWQGVELPGLHKDGGEVPLEITFGEINSDGRHLFTAVIRDITERKRAGKELQKNLSLLTSTFEATADGILVVDRDNKIVTYNRRFVEMWQIPDEIIDSRDNAVAVNYVLEQLSNADDFAGRTKHLIRHPETKTFDTLEFKDGKVYERHSRPQIMDGKVVGRVLSFRDVTTRKRAEEELRRSEEKYRTILETIEEGYYETDLAGNFTFFNGALGAYLKYDKDELKGVNYRQYVDGETADKFFRVYHDVFVTGRSARGHEYEAVCKDGTRVFGESSVSLIRDAANEPIGFRGVVRDVTERKRAENKLRESEALLAAAQRITHLGSWELDLFDLKDLNNNEVRWSDETYRIFGYEPGSVEVSYETFYNAVHPDDRARVSEVLVEAVEREKVYNIEHRIILPDGSERIVCGQAELTFDRQTGKPVKLLGTIRDIIEEKRAGEALRESEARYRLLFDRNPHPIWVHDVETLAFLAVNEKAISHYGYSREEFQEMIIKDLRPPEDRADFQRDSAQADAGVEQFRSVRHQKKDGALIEVEIAIQPINFAGRRARLTLITDVTEQKRADAALRESEYNLRTLVESMSEGLLKVDGEDRVIFVNDCFCRMVGYSSDELTGTQWSRLVFDDDGRDLIKQVNRRRRAGVSDNYEICLRKKSDEMLWVIVGGAPILDAEGVVTGSMGVFTDITERKRAENQLLHDAFHDGLTGLANRTLFTEHLQMTIDRTKRDRAELFAVLFLDFDRFKMINDSLGHAEGDNLLKQIARRLESTLRGGDLVARLGGDEFTILINKLNDSSVALRIAERIQKNLEIPFELGGGEIYTSASIGIALSTTGHERAEDMLRDADTAMYRAKAKGKAQHQVFDQAMHEQALAQLRIETELRQAIERKEFCLHYQPIFSLETNRAVGFESLVRWRHPELGMISPDDFIPIAEENNLIIPLGQWILRESCRQMREWQKANPSASSLTISVNLSFKQFLQLDLADQVAATLKATGLEPQHLKLEITESHVMENSEKAIVTMNRLRALGVELSLDDFGTGYSSLSYLHRLPVNYLKIDRSFVTRMIDSRENGEIVYTIIKLAQNLKMKVVAEGIETAEQLNYLKNLNCELGQGYYFSKPLEAKAAERFTEEYVENPLRLSNQLTINAELNM